MNGRFLPRVAPPRGAWLLAGFLIVGPAAGQSLPRAAGAPPAARPPASPAAARAPNPEERAARGIVILERGGQALAVGAVLAGDGRILTALSPLGHGNDVDARFADGTVVPVRLGHHDRAWDLALLVPQRGRWREGVTASDRDPVRKEAALRGFAAARGKVQAFPVVLRGRRALLGGDARPLAGSLEIGSTVQPGDLGSPIVDEQGEVVGVLGRACAPNEGRPCTPVAYGAPVAAIRGFLRAVPASAVPPPAWLGIQGAAEAGGPARGVRVLSVHPASPAADAALTAGEPSVADVIVAVSGVPVTSPEALAEAIRTHAVGEKVPLLLLSRGRYRTVEVVLREAPSASRPEPPPAASLSSPGAELLPLGGAPKARARTR